MNIYKIITQWNNNEWIIKQRSLDYRLSKLDCYETTFKYLLFIREHARKQKEDLEKTSFIEYPKFVEKVVSDNENILQDLKDNLDSLNPCHSLKEWIRKRP